MTGIIGDDDLERLINLSRKFDGGENSFKRGGGNGCLSSGWSGEDGVATERV